MSDLEQRTDTALTSKERREREECESEIRETKDAFTRCGIALARMRNKRLYRDTHNTFEDYCRDVWGFSKTYANNLITASDVVTTIVVTNPELPPPSNEAQARELARVPEAERAEVWERVVTETDGKPTAAAIREAVAPPRSGGYVVREEDEPVFVGRPQPIPAHNPFRAPETPEDVERKHLERTSQDIRQVLAILIGSFEHQQSMLRYIKGYIPLPPPLTPMVEVNSETLRRAADTLAAVAELWKETHEQ